MYNILIKIPYVTPSILLISNSLELVEHFKYYLAPYAKLLTEQSIKVDGNTEIIKILKELQNTKQYLIQFKNMKLYAANDQYLIRKLSYIINSTLHTNSPVLGLHCAIVERNNTNIIFMGASEAGKSTITAFLTNFGFNYITDDRTLINTQTLELVPFNKPIHLRAEAYYLLKNSYNFTLQCELQQLLIQERWFVYPKIHASVGNRHKIVVLDLSREKEVMTNIKPMVTIDAMDFILRNTIFINNIPETIKLSLNLLNKVDTFLLHYHDLNSVQTLIENIL